MLAFMLASALVPITNSDVKLELTAAKTNVLVGEFTKVRLKWTALKQVDVLFGSEVVLLDKGSGFRAHAEADFVEDATVALPVTLDPGNIDFTEHRLGLEETDATSDLPGFAGVAASVRFVFGRPGRYRVKARCEQAESNEVSIDVMAPSGVDAEIFREVQQQPLILTTLVGDEDLSSRARNLIGRYDAHPYLAPAILQLVHGQRPETFDQLRSFDFSQSALADELALRVADRGVNYLGRDWQHQALGEIVERFPDTVAAQEARRLLLRRDTEPPTLAVSPSPAMLWPPNHRLEWINVSLQLTDNVDLDPSVKLESITCDDGCDPARDISGAEFGTDDRQFALRSERRGSGTGRTYTVVYSAEDDAGNRTTTEAAVTVAHDQGRGRR